MFVRFPLALWGLLATAVTSVDAASWRGTQQRKTQGVFDDMPPPEQADSADQPQPRTCDPDGMSRFPFQGKDNSERLLLREGVIDAIPSSLCGHNNTKNVILVVGDGKFGCGNLVLFADLH